MLSHCGYYNYVFSGVTLHLQSVTFSEKAFLNSFFLKNILSQAAAAVCANSRRLQNFCTHSSIQLVRKHAKCVGTPFWRLSAIFTLISKLVVYQAVLMHKYHRRTPCTNVIWRFNIYFLLYFDKWCIVKSSSRLMNWTTYNVMAQFWLPRFFQNQMV